MRRRPETGTTVWGWMRRGLFLGITAAIVLIVGAAQAAPQTKYYRVDVTPVSTAVASTVAYTVRVNNCSTALCAGLESTQGLGSANVTVPAGLAPGSATSAPSGAAASVDVYTATGALSSKRWAATNVGGVLQFRSTASRDALAKGEYVETRLTVNACTVGNYDWSTQVKQSNDFSGTGNDFLPWSGSHLITTMLTASTSALSFEIGTIGAQTAGTPFGVSVTARDGCGNVADYDGTATLSGNLGTSRLPAPSGTAPSGLGTITFTDGVATPSVTAYKAETGRQLSVSASGVPTATSNSFRVGPGAAAVVEFTTEPADSLVNQPVVGPPTVRLVDTWGNLTSSTAAVTMGFAAGPTGRAFSTDSATTVNASGGVAVFSNLKITKSGYGYRLLASSPGLTSATSDAFNVYENLVCTGSNFPCRWEDPENITSVSINGVGPLRDGPLPGSLGIITSRAGAPIDPACGGTFSLGRIMTIIPEDLGEEGDDVGLEVTFRYGSQIVPSSNGIPHLRFCANDGPGTAWYEVLNCASPAVPKCITKRNAAGGADVLITALMTWTDPEWTGIG